MRRQGAEFGLVQAEAAGAAVGEVGAQAHFDAAEGEFGPRNLGFGEQFDGLAFLARGVLRRTQAAALEKMHLIDVGHVDHGEQGVDVDVGAGFLVRFAGGRVRRRFADFHETGGQRPVA